MTQVDEHADCYQYLKSSIRASDLPQIAWIFKKEGTSGCIRNGSTLATYVVGAINSYNSSQKIKSHRNVAGTWTSALNIFIERAKIGHLTI